LTAAGRALVEPSHLRTEEWNDGGDGDDESGVSPGPRSAPDAMMESQATDSYILMTAYSPRQRRKAKLLTMLNRTEE